MQYEAYPWGQSHPASAGDSIPRDISTAASQPVKRHTACDECRKRKLKCSGELSGCSRCIKQSLACHYSVQKQMGRPPKKRLREDNDDTSYLNVPNTETWANPQIAHISDLGEAIADVSEEPQILSSTHPSPYSFPYRLSTDEDHRHTWQLAPNESTGSIPATTSPWPDFSSVSAAAPKPFTMPPGLTPPLMPSHSDSSPDQECSCLSYLYLCLSHLSSLKPFPISQHTICSLYISARTARSVIRCPSCPTKFDTGLQNVMFTGTLLNVIADSWLRVSRAEACELGNQVAPPAYAAKINRSPDLRAAWNDYLRQLVRFSVIRGRMDLDAQTTCAQQAPSVLDLVEEMEARQRRWHESPDSHPLPPDQRLNDRSDQDCLSRDEQDLLCIRVAKSARNVIAKFGFQLDEYPESVPSLSPGSSSVSP
ncbi:Zn(II)2Cys6 transcription factor rglT [Aspergillus mulundensis]|uniref:Putative Zn(II)2Cys6 transcription factor n=1 Tax=Aspergillus mulundensis TaxID=1810919 RepID=A0A3D8RQT8_9EURO|nr:putative Zn(II)2Cys6 transcription factor [Aspergillus mulundensis]RDW76244.1 putative Zn(II)2Cys6 transcription factor [Aspergillus mulundensis]